ncbi:MAG: UBP-type zinc finger protein [Microbacteriaceae bacterium]|jgi:hypothetical protein|nr:UBP-type zinc finger protein [Microbacteriaceae bacterium]
MAAIDPSVPPSGTGCLECSEAGDWWFHLRRCAECGHVGCCDSSPNQHATKHYETTGHTIMRSFEPGETWFWDYSTGEMGDGPELAPPHNHPDAQPTPGPEGLVPSDWESRLHI